MDYAIEARDGAAAHPRYVHVAVAEPALLRAGEHLREADRLAFDALAADVLARRPQTALASLLVQDLHHAPERERHPEALFGDGAVHGGLWRCAYEPRSVLGLAALAGLPTTLSRSRRAR